jgi:DNA-binding GntR family transcriptional regulator
MILIRILIAAPYQNIETLSLLQEEGYDAYFTPEQTFHQRIVESAGNSPIAAAYRGLDVVLDVARRSIVRESGRIGGSTARSSRPMLPLIRMRPRMQCADTLRQQKRR